ncbi:hypothetical protein E2C01_041245 [Portunus trituberculatus]|uniref:Uncharacterized protein n=1 Tax=Portunus trituberculatus TaxID=210409 RepID=A0A5B7FPW4_PORTR|nr:hypothetical protein [Portunus trituberculatus]
MRIEKSRRKQRRGYCQLPQTAVFRSGVLVEPCIDVLASVPLWFRGCSGGDAGDTCVSFLRLRDRLRFLFEFRPS